MWCFGSVHVALADHRPAQPPARRIEQGLPRSWCGTNLRGGPDLDRGRTAPRLAATELQPSGRPRLRLNPEATFPLTKAQLAALAKLNLNLVPYWPQWETWRTPTASAWKGASRIMNRNEPGKSISYGDGGRDGFTLQFAAEDLVRLLGSIDPEKGLRESIEGIHAGGRLRGRPIITSIELVPVTPSSGSRTWSRSLSSRDPSPWCRG